jgi:hypothetical protein
MTVYLTHLAPEIRHTNGFVQFLVPGQCKDTRIVIFLTIGTFFAICICNRRNETSNASISSRLYRPAQRSLTLKIRSKQMIGE